MVYKSALEASDSLPEIFRLTFDVSCPLPDLSCRLCARLCASCHALARESVARCQGERRRRQAHLYFATLSARMDVEVQDLARERRVSL